MLCSQTSCGSKLSSNIYSAINDWTINQEQGFLSSRTREFIVLPAHLISACILAPALAIYDLAVAVFLKLASSVCWGEPSKTLSTLSDNHFISLKQFPSNSSIHFKAMRDAFRSNLMAPPPPPPPHSEKDEEELKTPPPHPEASPPHSPRSEEDEEEFKTISSSSPRYANHIILTQEQKELMASRYNHLHFFDADYHSEWNAQYIFDNWSTFFNLDGTVKKGDAISIPTIESKGSSTTDTSIPAHKVFEKPSPAPSLNIKKSSPHQRSRCISEENGYEAGSEDEEDFDATAPDSVQQDHHEAEYEAQRDKLGFLTGTSTH
ncbi:MAG: hypothetical protein P4L16_02115 [Chlamydiales bacterium]|nr:hypothetical protein [Chlamydiales bacterium]